MAENRGGYRRPKKPAPVSGPGAASRRTDGQPGETPTQAARYLSGENYGDSKEINSVAASAPMAAAATAPAVIPMSAPSQRPDEPVTAGARYGAGPGEDIIAPPSSDTAADIIREAYERYPSAHLRVMVQRLEAMGR